VDFRILMVVVSISGTSFKLFLTILHHFDNFVDFVYISGYPFKSLSFSLLELGGFIRFLWVKWCLSWALTMGGFP
jgi:hypothetical protein